MQPHLNTKRLLLRPFSFQDAKTVQELAGNPWIGKTKYNSPA